MLKLETMDPLLRPATALDVAELILKHCHSRITVNAAFRDQVHAWTALYSWDFLQKMPRPFTWSNDWFYVFWPAASTGTAPRSCVEAFDNMTPVADVPNSDKHWAHFFSVREDRDLSRFPLGDGVNLPKLLRVASTFDKGFGWLFPEEFAAGEVAADKRRRAGGGNLTPEQVAQDVHDMFFKPGFSLNGTPNEIPRRKSVGRFCPVFMLAIADQVHAYFCVSQDPAHAGEYIPVLNDPEHPEDQVYIPVLKVLSAKLVGQRDQRYTPISIRIDIAAMMPTLPWLRDPRAIDWIRQVLEDGGQLAGVDRPSFWHWRWRRVYRAYVEFLEAELGFPEVYPERGGLIEPREPKKEEVEPWLLPNPVGLVTPGLSMDDVDQGEMEFDKLQDLVPDVRSVDIGDLGGDPVAENDGAGDLAQELAADLVDDVVDCLPDGLSADALAAARDAAFQTAHPLLQSALDEPTQAHSKAAFAAAVAAAARKTAQEIVAKHIPKTLSAKAFNAAIAAADKIISANLNQGCPIGPTAKVDALSAAERATGATERAAPDAGGAPDTWPLTPPLRQISPDVPEAPPPAPPPPAP